jgi:hypothetical protein
MAAIASCVVLIAGLALGAAAAEPDRPREAEIIAASKWASPGLADAGGGGCGCRTGRLGGIKGRRVVECVRAGDRVLLVGDEWALIRVETVGRPAMSRAFAYREGQKIGGHAESSRDDPASGERVDGPDFTEAGREAFFREGENAYSAYLKQDLKRPRVPGAIAKAVCAALDANDAKRKPAKP